MTVGERIKEVRLKMGMSQVDFADKINVSKQTLYKYENNIITNIPSDKIAEAARIGDVSPEYLMGWESDDDDKLHRKFFKPYLQNLKKNISAKKEVNPMTQGERVKEIRKALNLTMEKFGEKLGVTKVAISLIEKGVNSLTDQMAKAICREYNVNNLYLQTGKGEMFNALPESILDELCEEYNMDELDRSIVSGYLQLSEADRAVLKQYVQNLIDSNKSESPVNFELEELEAAHDDGATAEQKKHADDIMHDPSEWE